MNRMSEHAAPWARSLPKHRMGSEFERRPIEEVGASDQARAGFATVWSPQSRDCSTSQTTLARHMLRSGQHGRGISHCLSQFQQRSCHGHVVADPLGRSGSARSAGAGLSSSPSSNGSSTVSTRARAIGIGLTIRMRRCAIAGLLTQPSKSSDRPNLQLDHDRPSVSLDGPLSDA